MPCFIRFVYFCIAYISWIYRRGFLPQTMTHDIMSDVLVQMLVPADKWKNYPMKDMLFKDFMVNNNNIFSFIYHMMIHKRTY